MSRSIGIMSKSKLIFLSFCTREFLHIYKYNIPYKFAKFIG